MFGNLMRYDAQGWGDGFRLYNFGNLIALLLVLLLVVSFGVFGTLAPRRRLGPSSTVDSPFRILIPRSGLLLSHMCPSGTDSVAHTHTVTGLLPS
jgi:hypothetical protein